MTSQVTTEKALNALPTFQAVSSQRHKTPHEKYVVHGHTPVKAPVIKHNRIAIDTGAVFGGKMTCVVLEADTLGFLTADPVDEPVSIAHR